VLTGQKAQDGKGGPRVYFLEGIWGYTISRASISEHQATKEHRQRGLNWAERADGREDDIEARLAPMRCSYLVKETYKTSTWGGRPTTPSVSSGCP